MKEPKRWQEGKLCVKIKRSKRLEPRLGKLEPEEVQGLPTRRAPSPRENKAPAQRPHLVVEDFRLLVGGRYRLRGGGRQEAAAQAGPETGGGGAQHAAVGAGARGPMLGQREPGGRPVEGVGGSAATATSPRPRRGRQWAGARRGRGGACLPLPAGPRGAAPGPTAYAFPIPPKALD